MNPCYTTVRCSSTRRKSEQGGPYVRPPQVSRAGPSTTTSKSKRATESDWVASTSKRVCVVTSSPRPTLVATVNVLMSDAPTPNEAYRVKGYLVGIPLVSGWRDDAMDWVAKC